MAQTGIRGVFARMNPAATNRFSAQILVEQKIIVQKQIRVEI